MRIFLAAVLAGCLMFIWSAVDHMFLPTGEMGLSNLPGEQRVMNALQDSVAEPGMYMFPGMDKNADDAAMQAWQTKYEAGPVGLLIYRPVGGPMMSPRMFLVELGADVVACIFAGWILSCMACNFGTRVGAATALGVIGWLSLSVSYWNWYQFPTDYIVGEAMDQIVGWLLAGLVLAAIVKRARPAAA